MKTVKLYMSVLLVLLLLFPVMMNAQETKLENFDEISIVDDLEIVLIQGDKESYSIDPSGEGVDVKKDGNKLTIKKQQGAGSGKIYLHFINLKCINMLGAGEVITEKEMQADQLKLNLIGSGSIRLALKAQSIQATVAGSGLISLNGTTNNLNGSITGSGDLKASRLIAENASIELTGSGDASINVLKSLNASVLGTGDIKYVGNPENRNVNIIGTGSIAQTSLGALDEDIELSINNDIKINMNTGSNLSGDTTRLSIGDRKIIIIEDDDKVDAEKKSKRKNEKNKDVKHVWAGLELGFCGYSNKVYNTTLSNGGAYSLDYFRSNVININPIERNFRIYKNYIAFTTGLGFQFNRFMFENNTILVPFKDSIQVVDNNINYKKNMLKASYLTLPLLLQFNTSDNHSKSFHIAIGGQLGLRMGSRSKQVYDVDGSRKRDINKNSYNLNPFQYGLTARIGYGGLNIFANYNLSDMFKNNKGPELYPFQIGLTLIPW
ncbi:MAG: GIN domain-containing protein [Bacteroidia bacterium]